MRYLLDSDAVTFFYDDQRQPYHTALHQRVAALEDTDVLGTSALVLCELEYSYWNAPEDKKEAIRKTISSLEEDFEAILPVGQEIASIFGELKARLQREKNLSRKEMRKHNIDLLLASSAIVAESVLIGMDRMYLEIARLHEGFRYENWPVPAPKKGPPAS